MTNRYDYKKIRDLLTDGFNDEELRNLCFDVSDFRPVYHQLAQNTGKTQIVQHLLEHVEKRELTETLLNQVKERNAAKYEIYQPYYRDIPVSTSNPDPLPLPELSGDSPKPRGRVHRRDPMPAPGWGIIALIVLAVFIIGMAMGMLEIIGAAVIALIVMGGTYIYLHYENWFA